MHTSPHTKKIDNVIIEFGDVSREVKSLDHFIKQCLAQSKVDLYVKMLVLFLGCKVDSGLCLVGKYNVQINMKSCV